MMAPAPHAEQFAVGDESERAEAHQEEGDFEDDAGPEDEADEHVDVVVDAHLGFGDFVAEVEQEVERWGPADVVGEGAAAGEGDGGDGDDGAAASGARRGSGRGG